MQLDQNDYNEWNKFVDLSPQGDVFCYSWWLDVVTKSRFKIYAISENGELVAGMPLAYDKYGKINEPFFTRTLGILYKSQEDISDHKRISNQRRWATALIENIPIIDFVQTCTHHNFHDWLPYKWKGFGQTTRYTYIIDYGHRTEDDLWSKLNRGRKNMINRAHRSGIIVNDSDDIELLYRLVAMSYKRQGMEYKNSLNDLEILDRVLVRNNKRLILTARNQSGQHAAIYLAYNKKSSYYLISGSDPKLRWEGGHSLVLWEAIRYFRDKVAYFNFGGSDVKKIEEHVKGYGGVLTPYFHIYNESNLRYLDVKYHLKSIFEHSKSIFDAFLIRYFCQ